MKDAIEVKPVVEIVNEAPAAMTPVELLRIAVTQGADIEKLTKLLDLQERYEASEARKAYNSAMKRFKASPPEILKNKLVKFETQKGTTSYHHATLDHVCDVVTKALSEVGISHSWKVSQEKDLITVSCVLTHELGHSESTQLQGVPDNSGSKNPIQAIGSTCSYLQRYTLLAACGLAASEDTDGKVPEVNTANEAQFEEFLRQMTEVETLEDLKTVFAKAYNLAQSANDRPAMAKFISLKNERKAAIENAAH